MSIVGKPDFALNNKNNELSDLVHGTGSSYLERHGITASDGRSAPYYVEHSLNAPVYGGEAQLTWDETEECLVEGFRVRIKFAPGTCTGVGATAVGELAIISWFYTELFRYFSMDHGVYRGQDNIDCRHFMPIALLSEDKEVAEGRDEITQRLANLATRTALFASGFTLEIDMTPFLFYGQDITKALRIFALKGRHNMRFGLNKLENLVQFTGTGAVGFPAAPTGTVALPIQEFKIIFHAVHLTPSLKNEILTELRSLPNHPGFPQVPGLIVQHNDYRQFEFFEDVPAAKLVSFPLTQILGLVEYFIISLEWAEGAAGLAATGLPNYTTTGVDWHNRRWESMFVPDTISMTVGNTVIFPEERVKDHQLRKMPKLFPLTLLSRMRKVVILTNNMLPKLSAISNDGHINTHQFNNAKINLGFDELPGKDANFADGRNFHARIWGVRKEFLRYIPAQGDKFTMGHATVAVTKESRSGLLA